MSPILSCSAFSHACMCRPLTDRLGSAAGPASRGARPARDGLRWSAGLLPAMAQTRARARPASRAGPCRRLEMFFSTPDLGNLLFAPSDRRFFNPVWFPYFARPTHVEEVPSPSEMGSGLTSLVRRLGAPGGRAAGPNMWMFEQPIGFLNITVNIRMTVVKLADGGLLVYNPIAPTGECLRELEALGVVRHIVLGSTALEHKVLHYMYTYTHALHTCIYTHIHTYTYTHIHIYI